MCLTHPVLSHNYYFAVFCCFPPMAHLKTVDRGFIVLVNVTVRWGIGTGATGGTQANDINFDSRLYCFIVLWGENIQQEYNMNYSYKLLTAFGTAPEVVYGLLPPVGRVADTTGITCHANLCDLTPRLLLKCPLQIFLYVMGTLVWEFDCGRTD